MLIARGCALTASRMLVVAVPWLVLARTGSATQVGLVTLAQTGPFLLTQTVAAPLLDRLPGGRVITACCVIAACALLLLAAVAAAAPLVAVAVAVAVVGAVNGPATTAKQAALPRIGDAAGKQREHAAALMVAAERGATMCGPALAGVLLTTAGPRAALGAAAALFAVAALAATALPPPIPAPAPGRQRYHRGLAGGWRHLTGQRVLVWLLVMYAIANWADEAVIAVLIPEWVHARGLHADFSGLIMAVFSGTAVLSAVAFARLGHRLPRRGVYLAGVLVSGCGRLVLLALGLPPAVVLAGFAVCGLACGPLNSLVTVIENEHVAAPLRNRVFALVATGAWLGIPVGGLTGALLYARIGAAGGLWICALAGLIAALPAAAYITDPPRTAARDRPA